MQDDDTMTVLEAAKRLKLSKPTVIRLIRQGNLEAYKKTPETLSAYVISRSSVELFDHRRRTLLTNPVA